MDSRIVVSDSGPLISLADIGQLEILPKLFEEILIPMAVWNELNAGARRYSNAVEVLKAPWLKTCVATRNSTENLDDLDAGETEAIGLARAIPDATLLIDDLPGRHAAARIGVRITGTAGLLGLAKKSGLLPLVRPYLEQLKATGTYLQPVVINSVLKDCGEL